MTVGEAGVSRADQLLETLLDRHRAFISQVVSRLAPRYLGVQQSEIEQETAIRVWRTLRNEREIRDFQSYVYRVAATAALDSVREVKQRQEQQLDLQEVAGMTESPSLPGSRAVSPEDGVIRRALIERVQQLVDALPPNRRRALMLHFQGFTSGEIAEIRGWSEPKARNLTYRGLEELRGKLREAGLENDMD